MNKKDGAWRLIYVGPAGQLIGSLKPQQPGLQLPGAPGLGGTPASALGSGFNNTQPGQSSSFGQNNGFGSSSFGSSTVSQNGILGAQQSASPAATPGTTSANGAANGQTDPMATPPPDSGSGSQTIIGGNIIGVGSTIDERSLRIYEKAKNYKLFEFIWDPSKDAAGAAQAGMQPGTVPGGAPIGQPIGQPIGSPLGGQPNPTSPGAPAQNPQQPTPAPQQ